MKFLMEGKEGDAHNHVINMFVWLVESDRFVAIRNGPHQVVVLKHQLQHLVKYGLSAQVNAFVISDDGRFVTGTGYVTIEADGKDVCIDPTPFDNEFDSFILDSEELANVLKYVRV